MTRSSIAIVTCVVVAAAAAACAPRRAVPVSPCLLSTTAASQGLRVLGRPFEGEYQTGSVFDHDLPLLFNDRNDFILTMCGVRQPGVGGHNGYDWRTPLGTPLLAVAEGRIVRAEQEAVTCGGRPGKGARVVVIEIRATATDVFRAMYGHLDRIDVVAGDTVHLGDTVGTSGNTGCTTGPHLHFSVARVVDSREVMVDPYGWHSTLTDTKVGRDPARSST